ncbi:MULTISPECIES: MBL fold metallo-hydrolase [unclassified Xanthobacter]|uniref:MBL fold metallo-hydrolase n=1 Tax=unclassified Xanthobacter TaxID=2623496 RepID=UPI001EDF8FB8|nr:MULTISPECIES: MBL fold metallo-hydrolase [unclassified Xanthobacter]
MSLTVTILGCGSSGGVPRVGQGWGACDPAEPRNRRRRCSILVQRTGPGGTTTVLVDTSPDLREQLLDADVRALDGVLFTHAHADHTHGIDDLRPLAIEHRKRIDVFADDDTLRALRKRFGYCFETPPGSAYPPILNAHTFVEGREVVVEGAGGPIVALPFLQHHGDIDSFGFRFGDMAYSSDVNGLPEASLAQLHHLDVWIIDVLRYAPHPSHFTFDEALGHIARLKPRRAILTDLHTDLDYGTLARQCPAGVEPAYDGMSFEVAAPVWHGSADLTPSATEG